MKITFCTREDEKVSGGQNTWLCRFLPRLREDGLEVRVLCFTTLAREELPMIRSLRQAGISCATVAEDEAKYTEQKIRWILKQLAEDAPDVFVCNMVIPAAYYAGRWLRQAGIATVGVCHGGGMTDFYPGVLDEFVLGRSMYQVSAYVCVSQYLRDDVLKRHPKRVRVRRIPCGISIGKEVANQPDGLMKLAYVGQLVEERKRILALTHAFCRLVREVPGTEALLYGDGPNRGEVEQILRDHGQGLPVRLIGFLENDRLVQQLVDCHAVVLLSDHEGLGLALLEGMARGLVPIGLRGAPGVTEFVRHNDSGLLVEDRGDSLVTAIRRLREEPALWKRLSRAARGLAEAEYSDEVCVARWQRLFREFMDFTGPRKPLRIPWRVDLPPVHPALAAIDHRLPPLRERALRRYKELID